MKLLELAAACLLPGSGDEPLAIDADRLRDLQAALQARVDQPDFPELVEQLALFAQFVKQDERSPTAGAQLLRLAEAQLEALRALGEAARQASARL